jgi:hypothetical protein
MIDQLVKILKGQPFPLHNEKATQAAIEQVFIKEGINFSREHRLSAKGIPDFLVDDIVVEVKIKGNRKQIFDQCMRYYEHVHVNGLILITGRVIGDFTSLVPANKQLRIINISQAWL